MSKAMQRYNVDSPIKFNGERFIPGDKESGTIELTNKDAAPLLTVKAISLAAETTDDESTKAPDQNNPNRKPEPESEEEKIAAVKLAIEKLDPNNEAHFTSAGKPDAKALTELVGWTVKASLRDAVWSNMQQPAE